MVISWLKDWYIKSKIRLKNIFKATDKKPKVPRKKLKLQLDHALDKFNTQVNRLDAYFDSSDLPPSERRLGKHIRDEVEHFRELQLEQIATLRLDNAPDQFLNPSDFATWILYQIYGLTEKIYHFLDTVEVNS